jgi:flagellum-specific peptidoglycan hydrolase FlgJ
VKPPEQQAAIARIVESAVDAERATGVPAEVTAAQAILESGYLEHAPGNNCFGIKAYAGCPGTQLLDTHEWFSDAARDRFLSRGEGRAAVAIEPPRFDATGRKHYACRDLFATFPSLADAFAYHGALLTRGVYAPAWQQYQTDHDIDAFIRGIARHYATDPQYAALISQLAHGQHVAVAILAKRGSAQNA